MKSVIKKIHRWFGFPLGLLFIVTFGTGLLTAIDELLYQAEYAGFTYQETTLAQDAAVLTKITQGKKGIRHIVMPSENRPYYQLRLSDTTFTYSIRDLSQVVEKTHQRDGFFHITLQLHRNFLLGKEGFLGIKGAVYVAWVSLLALLISMIGLWLWWPVRRKFSIKKIIPTDRRHGTLYYAHINGGVIAFVFIVLMSLTGASITYRDISQALFGVDKHSGVRVEPVPVVLDNTWYAWLSAVNQQLPSGKVTDIRYPRKQPRVVKNDKPQRTSDAMLMTFNVVDENSWLGLPNNKIVIDARNSTLVSSRLFSRLSLGEKCYALLKPLHTGRGLHYGYVLFLLFMSVLGTLMVLTGVVGFVVKKRMKVSQKLLMINHFLGYKK